MTFEQAVAFVLDQEGGVSDLAADSGGLTKFGISKRNHPDLDITNLTRKEAIEIYRTEYWQKLSCDKLPRGLDLLVFDAATNEGPARAVKMLQSVLKIKEDGVIGPLTIDLARKTPNVVTDYLGQRMYQYALAPQVPTFGHGWYCRLARAAQLAFSLGDRPEFGLSICSADQTKLMGWTCSVPCAGYRPSKRCSLRF